MTWSWSMIKQGDLVKRKYSINIMTSKVGLVIGRDSNGYLIISWSGKIEDFWDDYDLEVVSHAR